MAEIEQQQQGEQEKPVAPDGQQLVLFESGSELLTVEEDARAGKYSGAIIERNREKVKQICAALAEGIGILRIAKAFAVSPHTVIGIRDRHPDLIAMEEKQLARRYGNILKLSAERYEEALLNGSIPAAQLPVGMGIIFDKKQILEGKPTSIAGKAEVLSADRINELIASLPAVQAEPVPPPKSENSGEN